MWHQTCSTDSMAHAHQNHGAQLNGNAEIVVRGPVMLYGLHDRPPTMKALLAAFAHLCSIVAGIATAPLLIARSIGLSPSDTTYAISSAFMVSGIATFIQIYRFGALGSGLLVVQGTSFSFIAPVTLAAVALGTHVTDQAEVVGIILGSAVAGAAVTMVLSRYLDRLNRVITQTVAGVTIVLLGFTLAGSSLRSLFHAAVAVQDTQSLVWLEAAIVASVIMVLSTRAQPWFRLSGICGGLFAGYLFALAVGDASAPDLAGSPSVVLLEPLHYPLGFDVVIFLLLMPIFLITMTEAFGDLTATSMLSGEPVRGPAYWIRIKGGVLADGFNSVLAAVLGTFPNTTFGQTNAVIQLTGVASRYVGLIVSGLLLLLGLFPIAALVFQALPPGVLYGGTSLMFALIAVAGFRVLRMQANSSRSLRILAVVMVLSFSLTLLPGALQSIGLWIPDYLAMLLGFPVASGALLTALWEWFAPAKETSTASTLGENE